MSRMLPLSLLMPVLLLLFAASVASFTITDNGKSLTNYSTLTPSVVYTMNYSFPSSTITTGSSIYLNFSSNFNINSSSLSDCFATTSSAGTFANAGCTTTYTAPYYYVILTGIYPTTVPAQSFLSLKVDNYRCSLPLPTHISQLQSQFKSSSTTPAILH